MKSLKIALAALALTSASFGAFAAQQVGQAPADAQPIGTVSATSSLNLSDLESQLAQKADEQGATSYRIISASGNNHLYGNAELYK
ncbi:YdgH/BhsA/McbA-like domain containing protein [Nissabacter sp. SGAir0207]|uniref:multiple stress resistance protein BhsA n=1 Tax=Nissabacter sp. SGAir0207 TaxID=2126321 RepID=UPI0010CD1866|nr:YdgH/BhsA/McbA-like domain containing protein [Nissabacter sp. SGAir0207]QCR36676.1 multiple stress resistance protein BhsA [Nissabacter sp. SGAir0207]